MIPGRVTHVIISHDDGCPCLSGASSASCSCQDPDIKCYLQSASEVKS